MSKSAPPSAHHGRARRLLYWPSVRRNPVLDMLYSESGRFGVETQPLPRKQLRQATPNAGDILHIHWVHQAFTPARFKVGAARRARSFMARLRRWQAGGVHVLWTLHNRLSHDALFPDHEVRLRQDLAELADAIHIMNPDSVDLVRDLYHIDPGKVFTVPHPSYHGLYPAAGDRSAARAAYGVTEAARLLVTFGAVQRRKGLRRLIQSLDSIVSQCGAPIKLIVAGECADDAFRRDLVALCGPDPRIDWQQRFLPPEELSQLLTAADVVVCPYREALNSGVAVAAASFGRPVVIPHMLAPIFAPPAAVEVFQAGSDDGLVQAVTRALDRPPAASERTAWAEAHAPQRISAQFFEALPSVLSL